MSATSTAVLPETEIKSESCCAGSAKTNPLGVHGAICHIEITAPDLEKARAFYGDLFGWQFQPFQPTEMYFMTPAGSPCGCMCQGEADIAGKTRIYVNVDDIPATIAKASELGAKVLLPKTEIPGGHGFFAHLRAPEGNTIGIYCKS
jgi:hypothetical protein